MDEFVPAGFDVLGVLGDGASARVYHARHCTTHEDVALKVWRAPVTDPLARDRVLDEVRIHALLVGEPHVVQQIWASDVDDPHPWTATRLAGVDLPTWLRDHPRATVAERLRIAKGLLDGLSALHRRAIVHRDVSPHNVLVDEDGHARLGDLGLALVAGRSTRDNAAGTGGYVAPELDGDDAPSTRSDVYSAAAVIADLLGPDLTGSLEHVVVTRGLSARPSDRPADAAEFRRLLVAAAAVPLGGAGQRPSDRPVAGATDGAADVEAEVDRARTTSADDPGAPSGRRAGSARLPRAIRRRVGRHPVVHLLAAAATGAACLWGLLSASSLWDPHPGPATAAAAASPAATTPAPPAAPPAFPGRSAFVLGHADPAVESLDEALVRLGCTLNHDGDGYQPSPRFTEYTRLNVAAFQRANTALASDADGYPGPRTWAMLFDPASHPCS